MIGFIAQVYLNEAIIERGGMNRADHNRHPQHQDGIGYQDQKDDIDGNNQSAFSQQPFVVGLAIMNLFQLF